MDAIRIFRRNLSRRLVAWVLRVDHLQCTYLIRPDRKRDRRRHLLRAIGAASTDRSSRRPRRIARRGTVNVTLPNKKRARIVKGSPVGAASTDRSFRPQKRIAGRGMVDATVPEKKRSRIV